MTCETVRQRLIDHYYGELPPQQRREVAQHLTGCGDCALEYCRLDADLGGLGQLCDESPSPQLQARLRDRVATQFRPPWWRRLWRVGAFPIPAYQTALLLAAVLLAWLLVGPRLGVRSDHPRPVTPVVQGYDASRIVSLDPNLL